MNDDSDSEFNRMVFDMLTANRGGLPTKCEFCGQPYTDGRYPVPEEAQAWACSECVARWDLAEGREEEP